MVSLVSATILYLSSLQVKNSYYPNNFPDFKVPILISLLTTPNSLFITWKTEISPRIIRNNEASYKLSLGLLITSFSLNSMSSIIPNKFLLKN